MRWLVFLVVLLSPCAAWAHGVRSAYLEIDAQDDTRAIASLKVPVPSASLELVPPMGCTLSGEGPFTLECPSGLRGAPIEVRGMGPIVSETSVVVELADGTSASHLLTASSPRWTLPLREERPLFAYARLGVLHIATGLDHLLFLLGLVLVVRNVRAVLLAETAFTLSHAHAERLRARVDSRLLRRGGGVHRGELGAGRARHRQAHGAPREARGRADRVRLRPRPRLRGGFARSGCRTARSSPRCSASRAAWSSASSRSSRSRSRSSASPGVTSARSRSRPRTPSASSAASGSFNA